MINRRKNLIIDNEEFIKNKLKENNCIYPGDLTIELILELFGINDNRQNISIITNDYEQMKNDISKPNQYQEIIEENKALTKENEQLKNLIEQLEIRNEKLQTENNKLLQQPINKVVEEEYLDIVSNMQNIANLFTNYTNNIADFKRDINAFKYYSQFEKLIELVKKVNDYIDFNHKTGNDKINMTCLEPLKMELNNVIKNFGIEVYLPQCGDEYNSEFHQTEKPINYQTKIKECKNPGYKYEGNVIAKAEVVVFAESEVY